MIATLVMAPAVFAVTVWVSVTVLRILRPEEPRPPVTRATLMHLSRRPVRPPTPVGAAARATWMPDRDAWREFHHADYTYGTSLGVPEAWWDDVLLRRN